MPKLQPFILGLFPNIEQTPFKLFTDVVSFKTKSGKQIYIDVNEIRIGEDTYKISRKNKKYLLSLPTVDILYWCEAVNVPQ